MNNREFNTNKLNDQTKTNIQIIKNDMPIIIVRSDVTMKRFMEDCKKIYLTNTTNTFCGIDFEFNMNWKTKERYIGSMQIVFVFDDTKYYDPSYIKPIYILDP